MTFSVPRLVALLLLLGALTGCSDDPGQDDRHADAAARCHGAVNRVLTEKTADADAASLGHTWSETTTATGEGRYRVQGKVRVRVLEPGRSRPTPLVTAQYVCDLVPRDDSDTAGFRVNDLRVEYPGG